MAALRWASCVQRLPEPLGVPRRPVVAARPAVQQLPGSRLAASSQQFPIVAQAQVILKQVAEHCASGPRWCSGCRRSVRRLPPPLPDGC